MTTPERIILVTEQPLLILNFRELLQAVGLDCSNVVLSPEDLPQDLRVDQNCLVMIDSDCEVGWEALAGLRHEMPLSRFVIWCSRVTPQVVQKAMDAGMDGLLSTRLRLEDAAQALGQICQGERQFRFSSERQPQPAEASGLTPRERQIVSLVMDGRRNREIATALQTTEGSVKVYLNRIFWKTGAKSRHELALVGRGEAGSFGPRPSRNPVRKRAVDSFDAAWMLAAKSETTSEGEIHLYDPTKR